MTGPWATILQPLNLWLIENAVLNVTSYTRLGSVIKYIKYLWFALESPEPNIILGNS